jgi:guanylate kinase
VAQGLLCCNKNFRQSLTYTTRPPRGQEQDGQDYHFVSKEIFKAKLSRGEFLEHANNYGNWYGTNKKNILQLLKQGYSVILVIDIKGALTIKKLWPKKTITLFIMPERLNQLKKRFNRRHDTTPEQIKKRLETARWELAQAKFCDFLIINRQNKISQTIRAAQTILDNN